LEGMLGEGQRPEFWGILWERYVESKLDYRTPCWMSDYFDLNFLINLNN